jgi:uncharacterized protein (TIGR03083 family)
MSDRATTVSNLRTVLGSFGSLANGLAPDQWKVQSLCPDWTVRGVVQHVTLVEQVLMGWRPTDGTNPFEKMPAVQAELNTMSDAQLAERFRAVAGQRVADLERADDELWTTPSFTPVGQGTYGRFMAIREFDIWVHERDIRVPLGLPGDDDGPVAEQALEEVALSLGYIVGKKVGLPDGKSIVFDLTGPVVRRLAAVVDGRAKVVDDVTAPDTTVSTDSLTFMLLACGRVDPEEAIAAGKISWTGDDEWGAKAARSLRFTM